MADATTSRKLPNFYSAAGQMEAYNPASASPSKSPNPSSGQTSDNKLATATTLLEVVKKMDTQEQDPAAKKILQDMVSLAEQYMSKVQGGGGAKAAGEGSGAEGPGAGAGAGAGAGGAGGAGSMGGMNPPESAGGGAGA